MCQACSRKVLPESIPGTCQSHAATRLGMRMTIDGAGDELIRMQGGWSSTSSATTMAMVLTMRAKS
eukprot:6188761-Prymnesium_polylepis.1